jgi:hypothetical protein
MAAELFFLARLVPTFFFGTVSLRVGLCRAVFCLIGSESFLGTNMRQPRPVWASSDGEGALVES